MCANLKWLNFAKNVSLFSRAAQNTQQWEALAEWRGAIVLLFGFAEPFTKQFSTQQKDQFELRPRGAGDTNVKMQVSRGLGGYLNSWCS